MQVCSNSNADALELQQSYTKPSKWTYCKIAIVKICQYNMLLLQL